MTMQPPVPHTSGHPQGRQRRKINSLLSTSFIEAKRPSWKDYPRARFSKFYVPIGRPVCSPDHCQLAIWSSQRRGLTKSLCCKRADMALCSFLCRSATKFPPLRRSLPPVNNVRYLIGQTLTPNCTIPVSPRPSSGWSTAPANHGVQSTSFICTFIKGTYYVASTVGYRRPWQAQISLYIERLYVHGVVVCVDLTTHSHCHRPDIRIYTANSITFDFTSGCVSRQEIAKSSRSREKYDNAERPPALTCCGAVEIERKFWWTDALAAYDCTSYSINLS